ncbi:tetratricopeptide repeat protein [bacterium]|nr:tetratricopeptide repeat protein [bacterium]
MSPGHNTLAVRVIVAGVLLPALFSCAPDNDQRRIRLSGGESVQPATADTSTSIYLEPASRRAVAVFFFQNRTGDYDLDWLQQGLTEMFVRSLSQSQRLSVLGTERLYELTERLGGDSTARDIDMDMAAVFARKANLEAYLSGNITKTGDSLCITVQLHEADSGTVLREETAEGAGLEQLFSMVDHLSGVMKEELTLSFDDTQSQSRHLSLSEESPSIEAWQHYVNGVQLINRFRQSAAYESLRKAVEIDSNFVLAYISLLRISITRRDNDNSARWMSKLMALRDQASLREKYEIDVFKSRLDGDPGRTMEVSQAWLEEYPNDIDPIQNIGNIFWSLHKRDEAVRYYKRILSLDPTYAAAYNILGYIFAEQGNFQDAHAILDRYRVMEPDEPNPYDSNAEIFLREGTLNKAEDFYRASLARDSSFSYSLAGLAQVDIARGDYENALDIYLQRFLPLVSDRANKAAAYRQIALLQWRLGDYALALSSLEKLAEYNDNLLEVQLLREEIDPKVNDAATRRAYWERQYDEVMRMAGTVPIALNLLIRISLDYGVRLDETAAAVLDMLENKPDYLAVTGRFLPAILCMRAGLWEEHGEPLRPFFSEFLTLLDRTEDLPINYRGWSIYRYYNEFARDNPGPYIDEYRSAIDFCQKKELQRSEMVFRTYLADLYYKIGEEDKARKQLQRCGVPEEERWLFAGPYDNRNGFNKTFSPETVRPGRGTVPWLVRSDDCREGYIDLQKRFPESGWSVAYGMTVIKASRATEAQFRLGSNEAVKVFLNGRAVWKNNIFRDSIFDNDIINVHLEKGLNFVLVKVCNIYGPWGYYFRVTDKSGDGLKDIVFLSPAEGRER